MRDGYKETASSRHKRSDTQNSDAMDKPYKCQTGERNISTEEKVDMNVFAINACLKSNVSLLGM